MEDASRTKRHEVYPSFGTGNLQIGRHESARDRRSRFGSITVMVSQEPTRTARGLAAPTAEAQRCCPRGDEERLEWTQSCS
jgi:hypothetical protein